MIKLDSGGRWRTSYSAPRVIWPAFVEKLLLQDRLTAVLKYPKLTTG
jgi:hypothetical protein